MLLKLRSVNSTPQPQLGWRWDVGRRAWSYQIW